jgi:hypothetical protein
VASIINYTKILLAGHKEELVALQLKEVVALTSLKCKKICALNIQQLSTLQGYKRICC